MSHRIAQFNDGLGWRNKYVIDAGLTDAQALEELRQAHHQRWPTDDLRIIEEVAPDRWETTWEISKGAPSDEDEGDVVGSWSE